MGKELGFNPGVIQYMPIPGCSAGVDLESHDFEMPPDCARYLKNVDFPPNYLFGQRDGTKLIDRLLDASDPTTLTEYKGVDFLHYFTKSDQSLNLFYMVANNATQGILYSKQGYLNRVALRFGLKIGKTFAADFDDLTYMVNGKDKPFVVATSPWEGVLDTTYNPYAYWREAGLPTPSIASTAATVIADVPLTPGTLVSGKFYRYQITQGIVTAPSDVESNVGQTYPADSDSPNYVGNTIATSAGNLTIKLSGLPIPATTSPANKLYIYRTAELDLVTDVGTFYFLKEIDKVTDAAIWASGEWNDDGSEIPDETRTPPTNHDQPPEGAKFAFVFMNQMIYLKGSDVFYSKIGEPEHVFTLPLTLDHNTGSDLSAGFVDALGNCIVFKENMAYQLYRVGVGDNDQFDWRPISASVGCIAPRTICNTPYGVVFLSRYDWYIWDGSQFKKLRNKYGKSLQIIFQNTPQSNLRDACAVYDVARDRILLCYFNPNVVVKYQGNPNPAFVNNCIAVYDFQHAAGYAPRFIWPWIGINANCFACLTNAEGYGVIWYTNSVNGRICELYFSNYDEYVFGATTTWGPSTVSIIADPTDLDDGVFGGQLFYALAVATRTLVEIDGTAPDTFKWSQYPIDLATGLQNGAVLASGAHVVITGFEQILENGITIRFGATTGHTIGSQWQLTQSLVAGAWGKQLSGGFTNIADNGDGTCTVTSDTPVQSDPFNKLVAGSFVMLSGSDYDGYYQVLSVLTQLTFKITLAFNPAKTDVAGAWQTQVPAQWDSGSGNQIEWEVWLKEYCPPVTSTLIQNSHFILKDMSQMFGDLAPMLNNELEISVWDRSMNFLYGYQPIFTQMGGWDVDKYDQARFDTLLSETIRWDLPQDTRSSGFQIRLKYPRQNGGFDWSTDPPTPLPKVKLFGCKPKVKYLAFSYYNTMLQIPTTNEGL